MSQPQGTPISIDTVARDVAQLMQLAAPVRYRLMTQTGAFAAATEEQKKGFTNASDQDQAQALLAALQQYDSTRGQQPMTSPQQPPQQPMMGMGMPGMQGGTPAGMPGMPGMGAPQMQQAPQQPQMPASAPVTGMPPITGGLPGMSGLPGMGATQQQAPQMPPPQGMPGMAGMPGMGAPQQQQQPPQQPSQQPPQQPQGAVSAASLQPILETQQQLARGLADLAASTKQISEIVAQAKSENLFSLRVNTVGLGLLMVFCEAVTQWPRDQLIAHLSAMLAQGQIDAFINQVIAQGQGQGKG